MKTSELTGAALDWAVAVCEGDPVGWMHDYKHGYVNSMSTDWELGGPIIERERINLWFEDRGNWAASTPEGEDYWSTEPLVAAMRCYVASKLGDEVEIPEELK